MKIAVFGLGYVGLVLSTCLASKKNEIMGVDVDEQKIKDLMNGKTPIFEPGIPELLTDGLKSKRLQFTTDSKKAIDFAEIIYICVGTPAKEDDSADLSFIEAVAKTIGQNIKKYKIIAIKSTVPPGTAEKVEKIISKYYKGKFDIVSNPEFLREGTAVLDFQKPDRTVIGVKNTKGYAAKTLDKLFCDFKQCFVIVTNNKTAEMIKYASNAFLANQISYINMIADLCDKIDADIDAVSLGMKMDERIGLRAYLSAGIGYGGSCFTKDLRSLISISRENNSEHSLLTDIEKINHIQRHLVIKKAKTVIKDLANKKIAIWGLSFKPNSDDLRDAPSIDIVNDFIKEKAKVFVYDPIVDEKYKKFFPNVTFCKDHLECVEKADCLVLATGWKIFRTICMEEIKKVMNYPLVVDGRNLFDNEKMKKIGFKYIGFGK